MTADNDVIDGVPFDVLENFLCRSPEPGPRFDRPAVFGGDGLDRGQVSGGFTRQRPGVIARVGIVGSIGDERQRRRIDDGQDDEIDVWKQVEGVLECVGGGLLIVERNEYPLCHGYVRLSVSPLVCIWRVHRY